MTRESLLALGRTAALAGMVDSGTLTRDTTTATNPDTGMQTVSTATIYAGACRIQTQVPPGATPREAGEATRLMLGLVVQLPISVTGARTGDIFTVTASAHDADLVGRRFIVRELAHKTHLTARRLGVEEIT